MSDFLRPRDKSGACIMPRIRDSIFKNKHLRYKRYNDFIKNHVSLTVT